MTQSRGDARKLILHVINGLGGGGAEGMLVKLLEASTGPWRHAVISLVDKGIPLGTRFEELGIPVYCLGLNRSVPNPFSILSVMPIARRLRPQLIEGWLYYGNLLANLAAASLPGRVPVLWNIQGSLYDIKAERIHTAAAIRMCVRRSRRTAAVVYNSHISAKQHEQFGFRSRQVYIPSGIDCRVFHRDEEARRQVRAEFAIDDAMVLIGLIARFHPMKDHATFLQAAAIVAREHPNVRFALIGSNMVDQDPRVQKLVVEHGLEKSVHVLGARQDMARFTNALDVACSSSAWGEGCSNAIGEAMACEVPCVVTDVGDSAFLVSDCGIAVPPSDPQAFARGLAQLVEAGAEGRRKLGAAARARIERRFALPVVVRAYEDLYEEYLESAKPVQS